MTLKSTSTFTDITNLLKELDHGPFISIYCPIEKSFQKDKTRLVLKQLYKEAEEQFNNNFSNQSLQPYTDLLLPILEEVSAKREDLPTSFGIIVSSTDSTILSLDTTVAPQVCVSTWPNLLPYIAEQQLAFNFDLLALNQDSFQVYSVTSGSAEPLELPDTAPKTLELALGSEISGGNLNFHSHAGGHGEHASYHGHNTADEEREIDHRNYYQAVADYLHEFTAKRQNALVLFALPENQSLFRQIVRNPYLAKHLTIERSPLNLSVSELATEVEKLRNEWQAELLDIVKERYEQAANQTLIISARQDLISAARNGQIDILLLDQESLTMPVEDWVLEVCDQVLRFRGRVRIFPDTDYPTEEPITAIKRYR